MIILFTLWFILQWQFPTWLWIISGLAYAISLRPKRKFKKRVPFKTQILPISLLLAIIFGMDSSGSPILPETISFWVVIGIFFGSVFIRLIIASPMIKKEINKSKNKNSNITIDGEGIQIDDKDKNSDNTNEITINDDDELKLHIKIKNKGKNKTSNFKIGLEKGFIKETFIKNIVLKGMQKSWDDPIFKDESGEPLFKIYDIYNAAKNNPIKGELFSFENDEVLINISIK